MFDVDTNSDIYKYIKLWLTMIIVLTIVYLLLYVVFSAESISSMFEDDILYDLGEASHESNLSGLKIRDFASRDEISRDILKRVTPAYPPPLFNFMDESKFGDPQSF